MNLIKKPNEIDNKTVLKGLIYGVPGGGKTTLALSAPKPLLIDTDNGVTRVERRFWPDTVQVKKYEDVLAVLTENLDAYDTVVVDTAGKLVDYMCDYAMSQNPAYRQSDGSLTQKGWGAVKAMFKEFFRTLEKLGKNLIFVAHEKEAKDGEVRILRPDIAGSAKNDLIKELDFMGYLDIVNDKRTLHLSPTAKFYAKNSIGVCGCLPIWDTGEKPNLFLSDVLFAKVTESKRAEAVKKQAYDALVAQLERDVQDLPVNEALERVQRAEHIWDSKLLVWRKLSDKASVEGMEYDKTRKRFVKAAKGAEHEPVSADAHAV